MTALGAFDARRAMDAPGLLREFNDAGVLAPADVHVARRLAELAGENDEWVSLAAALAVRGPRLGHVYVDLETIHRSATVDAEEPVDLATLPWPAADAWLARLEASPLVAVGEDGTGEADRPLRLVGTSLYLDRYWREERRLAADLRALRDRPPADVRDDVLADGLARLFGDEADGRQHLAAEAAVRRRFAVVAGGPGTGKTTTVARIVALLYEQAAAAGAPEPLVALAAPTGKAAARLIESVHAESAALPVSDDVRECLLALDASTLHRLLGWRPGTHSRFRHDRANRLPHDVVIVDETSMVSLSLMARLVEAVRPEARLVLVGDPGQLTSIEAGAVLGDIVGPAAEATSADDGIVVLDRVYRYGRGIDRVADAIRRGDADAVLDALSEVTWIASDAAASEDVLAPIHDAVVASARAVMAAASAGAGERALDALGAFRLLCAHRRGDHGVTAWTSRIESWLAQELDGFGAEGDWYVGRPLLVTQNDYGLHLYNGDTGVVIASGPGRVTAAFERHGDVVEFSPTRLAAVETVYAMTVHKSQGSQFDTAAVLLPDPASPILTRELLYTAVTRARRELILVGTEESIRTAVSRPVARASGLRWRLSAGSGR
jgi:exodeoxyribonuclease V alpha subunit